MVKVLWRLLGYWKPYWRAVLFAFFKLSHTGKAIRACADNHMGALVVGLNVKHLYALTFGIGSACVGAAGAMMTLLIDTSDPEEVKTAKRFSERLVERSLAMDGTCTGEHGVGQGKMKYLLAEHGEPALAAMGAIKRAFDPKGIMNPGKIV